MFRSTFLVGGIAALTGAIAVNSAAAQPRPVFDPQPERVVPEPAATPAEPQPAASRSPADNRARITLMVPEDARVWFEGKKTTATGTVREFRSPPLDPGSRYSYTVRVSWRQKGEEMTQTRDVVVTAGANVALNFLPHSPPVPPPSSGIAPPTRPITPFTPTPIR